MRTKILHHILLIGLSILNATAFFLFHIHGTNTWPWWVVFIIISAPLVPRLIAELLTITLQAFHHVETICRLPDDFESYAAKNLAIWITPVSEPTPGGRVSWQWEIEILPFTPIGQFYMDSPAGHLRSSFREFNNFRTARSAAFREADSLILAFSQSAKK